MGDVARADLLAGPLDTLKEADGDRQAILEEFFGIVWTNHRDGLGNGCSEPWCDLLEQERFCFAVHGRDLMRKKPRVRARVTKKSMWNYSRGILRNFHKIGAGSESQM